MTRMQVCVMYCYHKAFFKQLDNVGNKLYEVIEWEETDQE